MRGDVGGVAARRGRQRDVVGRRRRRTSTGKAARQSLASCTRRSSASTAGGVGPRDRVLHLQETDPAAADEHAVRVVGPGAGAERPGRHAGQRRHQRRHPPSGGDDAGERAVGEDLVVPHRPPARQRREPLVQRHPGVALQQRHVGVREPVELDVVGARSCSSSKPSMRRGERARPLDGAQRERRHRLQRHGGDHAERAEADPGGGEDLGVPGRRRSRAPSPAASPAPARAPAWPGRRTRAPVPWVPVASAPATVCRSMSPRLVSDQPAADELGVQPVQRHPGADRDQPVVGDLDQIRRARSQTSWMSSGRPIAGERVAAADRPHPPPGGRRPRSGPRRPRRPSRDARPRCRRARCRPSCASACGSPAAPEPPSRSLPRRSAHGSSACAGDVRRSTARSG